MRELAALPKASNAQSNGGCNRVNRQIKLVSLELVSSQQMVLNRQSSKERLGPSYLERSECECDSKRLQLSNSEKDG